MARATPLPGWGPTDEGRPDGTAPFARLRRAWYTATGVWPRRWHYENGGEADADAAQPCSAEEAAEREREQRQSVGLKLLPAPGSAAAQLIGGKAVIPHSAGVFQTAPTQFIDGSAASAEAAVPPSAASAEADAPHSAAPPSGTIITQEPPPLAVMVGWFNAEKVHVDKHLELYAPLSPSDRGWDVLWFPVPAYSCLVPYGGYKLAEKILGILELLLVHPRPLVLHLISGGAFIFAACCDLMRHLPHGGALPASFGLATATPSANAYEVIRKNLCGIVYDSPVGVPGIGNAVCGVVGVDAHSLGGVALKAVLNAYYAATYPVTIGALCRVYMIYRHQDYMFPGIRMLFIYSDDDIVAGVDLCRTIVMAIARRGFLREVTNINIDGDEDGASEHVRHLQHHPEIFVPAVGEFLGRCLADAAEGVERPLPYDDDGAMDGTYGWQSRL